MLSFGKFFINLTLHQSDHIKRFSQYKGKKLSKGNVLKQRKNVVNNLPRVYTFTEESSFLF
jgi:hypothetical protein